MKKKYLLCTKCGEVKHISRFNKGNKYKRGYQYHCKECKAKEYAERVSNPETAYKDMITSARRKKIVFALSFSDFMQLWQKPCTYCGAEIENIAIDRIDNNTGYTRDNSTPCCWRCNEMKSNYDVELFINECKAIARRFP